MPIEDRSSIAKFLKPHCAVPAGDEVAPRYARMRAGRSRKTADTIWRRELVGEKPEVLATEVLERVDRLGKGEKAWLEILERSGRSTIDHLPLGSASEGEEGDGNPLDEVDTTSPQSMVAPIIAALVQTNGQFASMVVAKDERYHDLLTKHIEVAGRATAAETLLQWFETHGMGNEDDMLRAVEALAPTLGPAVATLVANWEKKKASDDTDKRKKEGKPETVDAKATRLLSEVEQLWQEHPEAILTRPDRLLRLKTLGDQVGDKLKAMGMGGGQ